MGTEYYLVKHDKKEVFYLGKRISHLDGVPNSCYKTEPDFSKWETVSDVFEDIYENSTYFLEPDMKWGEIQDACWAIYDFCDDKVILDNDCSDTFKTWSEYKEVGNIHDYFISDEELISDLVVSSIPEDFWVVRDNVIYEYETIKKLVDILKEEEKI